MSLTEWVARMQARHQEETAGRVAGRREGGRHVVRPAILMLLLCMIVYGSKAQNALFVQSGVITYEKRVNATATRPGPPGGGNNSQGTAEFTTSTAKLAFNGRKSLFTNIPAEKKNTGGGMGFFRESNDSKTATDIVQGSYKQARTFITEKFFITDTLPQIKWRMVQETREIAGYECKRANGLVLDSVYIVAYYTDQILPSIGPERIHGLPGTILGLAIPDQHVTWFATKVENRLVPDTELLLEPQKGAKEMTGSKFTETIQQLLQGGGPRFFSLPQVLLQ